jgi:hypothetical protein
MSDLSRPRSTITNLQYNNETNIEIRGREFFGVDKILIEVGGRRGETKKGFSL